MMLTRPFALAALLAVGGTAWAANPAPIVTLTFQQGLNGYSGAADTYVSGAEPAFALGNEVELSIDASDGGLPSQSLIRFDGLFGNAIGQINPGDTIVSATLTVQITSAGSGVRVFEMLQPWNEASVTWNSLGGGIQTDGIMAASTPLFSVGANDGSANIPEGTYVFDFTQAVQRMQSGTGLGLGWALMPFMPDGTNGLDFYTREWSVVSERPLLTVQVTPVPEPGTWAMLAAGLVAVAALQRRRRS
jgi:hypothetical protein